MDIGDNWSESHDVWLYSLELVSENVVWAGYSQTMIIAWHVEVSFLFFLFLSFFLLINIHKGEDFTDNARILMALRGIRQRECTKSLLSQRKTPT